MKKVIAILVCVAMVLAISPLALMATYSDMPSQDHWSYKALSAAVEQGLLQGSNGKLLPNDKLTRAQMATILVRADKILIVETANSAAGMRKAAPTMAKLGLKLAKGEELGASIEEGYLPNGIRKNFFE